MQRPCAVVSSTSFVGRADRDVDDAIALVQLHGDLAVAVDVLEVGQRVAADAAGGVANTSSQRAPLASSSGSGRIEVMRSPCAAAAG